jgi:hypothetical protein
MVVAIAWVAMKCRSKGTMSMSVGAGNSNEHSQLHKLYFMSLDRQSAFFLISFLSRSLHPDLISG